MKNILENYANQKEVPNTLGDTLKIERELPNEPTQEKAEDAKDPEIKFKDPVITRSDDLTH